MGRLFRTEDRVRIIEALSLHFFNKRNIYADTLLENVSNKAGIHPFHYFGKQYKSNLPGNIILLPENLHKEMEEYLIYKEETKKDTAILMGFFKRILNRSITYADIAALCDEYLMNVLFREPSYKEPTVTVKEILQFKENNVTGFRLYNEYKANNLLGE